MMTPERKRTSPRVYGNMSEVISMTVSCLGFVATKSLHRYVVSVDRF